MKTVCFIETDKYGNIEWSEGCVAFDKKYFPYSKELVDREEAELIIEKLKERISEYGWMTNPDRMGY